MELLIMKPGMIAEAYKEKLEAAGYLLVESEDPSAFRLIRCEADLPGGELLRCAAIAIGRSDASMQRFGKEVAEALAKNSLELCAPEPPTSSV